ncbi:hypothetical protein [Natrinema hispanicum]|uniref:5-methylcytosine-specific restriction endonuclease McrBC, regulatory subunit McrC n=1 Tax=Natrinema hispanicum TaxID=392421 RepID=A0A1I0FB66_9EURY|nr:hypothetical protein [Natrinema hispanicum]SET54561.1 5-methylcytosine-specific restriction endonuclease McrBC, regulatory subunit McrC [Natrinema hispanicum]
MSIRPGQSRDVEGALQPRLQVEEKGKRRVRQYPPDIVDQLKRAAFIEGEAANTYIKRVSPTNDNSDPKVVTVEVRDNELVIDVEDIVGIVNLTPNATLQIDPKIGWGEILEMFLDVGYHRRSLRYRGIPIRDFLADDIGIEDIFIVVAVNYLNSLDDIFRHGFIRSFERRRTEALDARGQIDIHSSLRNFDLPKGVPKHVFVQKDVEYSIPVNDLIYRAGKELQRLFHLYAGASDNQNYTRIYSRLERAIKRLESRGVTGKSVSLSDIPEITTNDIPRQRHYYAQALEISKTILSSSIGQPLDQGREELLMEYIIGMESLFEEYVGLALTEELEYLQGNPMIDGLDSFSIKKESYQLFEDDSISLRSQPDHVIRSDEGVEAVLDSKYYAKAKNPLKGSWSRSRLLSYGFHLETENLAMVAPLAEAETFKFQGRSGGLTIITPEADEFSTEGLRKAIQDYLRDRFGKQRSTNATTDLRNRPVCHPEVEASNLTDIIGEKRLTPAAVADNTRAILNYIVRDKRLSNRLNPREVRPILGANRKLQSYLENEVADGWDVVVPFFIPAGDPDAEAIAQDNELLEVRPDLGDANEYIRIHCFQVAQNGLLSDHYSPPPFGLNW